ncbi:NADP-dependent oxidoreductase domain-containing protein [Pyronema omphalodes]|nr:NADP-dependent oxidoreductase domain-containing protein [Pyronema omphalodes]
MPTLVNKEIGPIGYGLMGLTWRPQVTPDPQAFSVLRTALKQGANFWNAGEFYGNAPTHVQNLELLNRYFTAYPGDASKVVLSVKGGVDLSTLQPKGDPESVRKSVDNVLRVLDGKKFVDIFQCARVDPNVPVEETIAALAEYVKAGKIGGIGLSEVSAGTIRRAHAVHPIAAVEVEVSLWSRDVFSEKFGGVARTCKELGIPVVAYSPLGRGFLTGRVKREELKDGDYRKSFDRFQEGAFETNYKIVEGLQKIVERKGCTMPQLAIGWVLKMGEKQTIIPIPGATTEERVKENTVAVDLSEQDMKEIEDVLAQVEVVGLRYNKYAEGHLMT